MRNNTRNILKEFIMMTHNKTLICAAIFTLCLPAHDVFAQEAPGQTPSARKIIKKVEPVPYWVGTNILKLRDNPVAGRIVGDIAYGQKVLAYTQYENWARISKDGEAARWVNTDFLSNSRLSWANYNDARSSRSSDVIAVRIKDPSDRKNRTFGVRLKTSDSGNALITTRQNTAQGIFFQNRFVSCEDQAPIGMRLVGEGYNFLDAQDDHRGSALDIFSSEPINDPISGSLDAAISAFACKAKDF